MDGNGISWWRRSTVYHIYPLGYCGAPRDNDFAAAPEPRLKEISRRLDSIHEMGFSALYLGPVFESTSHGYDTADYERVDRRLGTNTDLRALVDRAHAVGMRVILDGVLNHVGRDFWAFADLRRHARSSRHATWFRDVDFESDNRFADGFSYRGWEGMDSLVTLNHDEPAVVEYLLHAVEGMIAKYDIDGLRLDVAYLLPRFFLEALRRTVDMEKAEFLLLGEVIHGDYASYLDNDLLDSVTNYQGYKALWSSHNDGNYFELAHTFERLISRGGKHAGRAGNARADEGRGDEAPTTHPAPAAGRGTGGCASLCTFVDNHDVDRIASKLSEPGHLFPIHALLFTLPGVPAVYYGSEWAHAGRKSAGDEVLRPTMEEVEHRAGLPTSAPACTGSEGANGSGHRLCLGRQLRGFIRELASVRAKSEALQRGGFRVAHLSSTQLGFLREIDDVRVLVLVNAERADVRLSSLPSDLVRRGRCLFSDSSVDLATEVNSGGVAIPAFGTRIVELDRVE